MVNMAQFGLGKGGATKADESLEKFQRGGGHFQSKKNSVSDLYIGPFLDVFQKKFAI